MNNTRTVFVISTPQSANITKLLVRMSRVTCNASQQATCHATELLQANWLINEFLYRRVFPKSSGISLQRFILTKSQICMLSKPLSISNSALISS